MRLHTLIALAPNEKGTGRRPAPLGMCVQKTLLFEAFLHDRELQFGFRQ
jgi:hypothetical protein